ncbi:MAG TPA: CmcI family methyltransferase [Polyangia bacterium]|nr:CmcI family methyltransferase [Polyangia bacterium]
MKLSIDTDEKRLTVERDGVSAEHPLYSAKAFSELSEAWVKVGWGVKYIYGFTWMGRPIIQLPDDLVRIQEVIYRVRPDVVIETGVAHGGSLIFYASLFKAMGKGRVIGVDIEIRPHNRKAIESHELSSYITLVEGSSTDPAIVKQVSALLRPGEKALVILDSNHTKKHVADELRAYAPLVSSGSYLVATDGVMQILHDVPRGKPEWVDDNPTAAAAEFAQAHAEFVLEEPPFPFNEGEVTERVTHWPGAYLRRR